jgi:serine/threonine protein kinase
MGKGPLGGGFAPLETSAMPTHEPAAAPNDVPPADFLKLIRKSGVLADAQFEEVRARVLSGDLPYDAEELARRLVRDEVLTEYQAARLLRNKPHGMALSKYVILDKIGAGSMGRVYKARHLLMGRVVALKIIAPELSANPRIVARFQREMKMVGRLDHPNVVRAFDADQVGGSLFIVMEYVPGQSLGQQFRSKGPLPALEVLRHAAQAVRGLGHAHAQGVVHRDVKPSNVLIGEDGRVRMLDLGLGVLLESDNAAFATADGIAVGTIDYMSPEQACGRDVDGRSDLYSLGCTLYHVISGQRIFPGDSDVERLGLRINGTPRPLSDLVPDLPRGVQAVMDRLLANKPKDRYQTAEEAAEAIEAVLDRRDRPRPQSVAVNAAPNARPAAAPVSPAPAPRVVEKRVEVLVEPDHPAWFRPLARLAERAPGWALAIVLLAGAMIFGLGFVLAWLIRG